MKDIEIYHITNQQFFSNDIYLSICNKYDQKNISILIDDYNFDHSLSLLPKEILDICNVVGFEKSFVSIAEQIISALPTECVNENLYLKDHPILIKRKDKFSCAILTSAWYLARLGLVEFPKETVIKEKSPATAIINVLHKKFIKNEKQVIEILKNIYPESVDKISYCFYDDKGGIYESF